jgi:hypothetical protein
MTADPAVRRAWRRYLRETREAEPNAYERVELRAWRRLTSTLAALGEPLPEPAERESVASRA